MSDSRANDPVLTPVEPLPVVATALVTLGLGLVGWGLVDGVQGRSLAMLLRGREALPGQLAAGIGYGAAAGWTAWRIVTSRPLAETMRRYLPIGRHVRTPTAIVLLSLCAGLGEEILFRGALQHWLGILATSVVFVLVHGYLTPRNRWLSLYGLFLMAVMIPLGLAAARWGLAAPIAAHATIDIVLFSALARASSDS